MNVSKISVRYSKALLKTALDKNNLDQVYQDMLQLFQICQSVNEFMLFLHNPVILQSKKKNIIRAVFSGKVTELTLSFLELIIKNKREIFIPDISRRFLDDYKRHKGITTVALTTVVPLDEQLKNSIVQLIKTRYKTTVELEEEQNNKLIGGFIITIDDKMMDASVLKALNQMRREMITREFKHH